MESDAESAIQGPSRGQQWGGKRPGAGRRPRDIERWIAARGLKPASAAEILERADERRIWYRLLNSEDETIALRALTYLTDRRDGRAAQQINITQNNVRISAEEIERARAVVREIAGERPTHPLALTGHTESY
jgi:hypothetical protein